MTGTGKVGAPDRPSAEAMRRYVQRRASPDEEEAIELAMMENPELLDDIQVDQVLGQELAHLVDESVSPDSSPALVGTPRPLNWAIAAALLLGLGTIVTGAGWLRANQALHDLRSEATTPRDSRQVALVTLVVERGSDVSVRVPPGASNVPILFEVPLTPPFASNYRLELWPRGQSTPTLAVDRLIPQGDGRLVALVERARVPSGEHTLRVLATDADGERQLMQLDVVAE